MQSVSENAWKYIKEEKTQQDLFQYDQHMYLHSKSIAVHTAYWLSSLLQNSYAFNC